MIIVVEGIDRVGKTTLVEKLSKELNIPVFKHDSSLGIDYHDMKNDEETDKMLQMIRLLKLTNGSIIFDRFHLSDYTYGCFERKYKSGIAFDNFAKIEHALREYADSCGGVFEILVRPTDVKRSSAEHGKDLTVYDIDMYYMIDMFVNESKNKCTFVCNYDTMDYIVGEVKATIKESKGGFHV